MVCMHIEVYIYSMSLFYVLLHINYINYNINIAKFALKRLTFIDKNRFTRTIIFTNILQTNLIVHIFIKCTMLSDIIIATFTAVLGFTSDL